MPALLRILKDVRVFWRPIVLVFVPIVLLPFPLIFQEKEVYCGYVVLIMAVYWMTEVVPLAVTALLPLVLYPILGVVKAKEVATTYLSELCTGYLWVNLGPMSVIMKTCGTRIFICSCMGLCMGWGYALGGAIHERLLMQDSNFVFFGSMMMALAVEESQLHKRIALRILLIMGPNPRLMMLGFQLATAVLSMWMSNTATTAMMVPVAMAVIEELASFHSSSNTQQLELQNINSKANGDSNDTLGNESGKSREDRSLEESLKGVPPRDLKMYKGLLLAICYSANIGGTGTLTGTGSNIVLSGDLEKFYENQDTITFASWMAFAIPSMIVCLFFSWIWLQLIFVGFRKTDTSRSSVRAVIRKKYDELGAMSFAETVTLILFILLVVLWIFRDPKVFPGWGSIFVKGYVTDGTTAMFIGCILFAIPKQRPDFFCFSSRDREESPKVSGALLGWKSMQRRFAWDVILLVGGGYAMASGVRESHLSEWLGRKLSSSSVLSDHVLVIISVICVTFITEFSSNVATATIFIPILNSVAQNLYLNPLYLVLPVTIACSFAFMLPVATPPNAIVFSAGLVRVYEMAATGFVMNWICIGVTLLNINTYATWLFNLDHVPLWAQQKWNITAINATSTTITSIASNGIHY